MKPGAKLRATILTNAGTMAMNVAASVIAARMLGPVGRGSFAVIQMWPIAACGLGTLGIPRAVAYYLARRKDVESRVIATGVIVLLVAAILVAAILYTCMPWLTASQPHAVRDSARWCLSLLPILFLGSIPHYVLQGLDRLKSWNLVRLQFPILWVGMHAAGFFLGRTDLKFYVWGYAAVTILHNLTWLVVFVHEFPLVGRPDGGVAKKLLLYGAPLTLGIMPQFLNLRVDQVLMAAFVRPEVLGIYVAAVAWSGLILPVLAALSQVLFPMILGTPDLRRQHELLGKSLRLSAICAAVCAVGLMICTPFAIPCVYGRAFTGAVLPACILALGSVSLSVNNILSEGLRALGLPKYPMYAEFAGLLVTGVLLLALLPRWPLIGASVASFASYAVTTAVLMTCVARTGSTTISKLIIPQASDVETLGRVVRQFIPVTT